MADDRDPRLRLLLPLAALIGVVWFAMAVLLVIGDGPLGFEVTTGPFTVLCGWAFGGKVIDAITTPRDGRGGR